jgi:hypothetical protein
MKAATNGSIAISIAVPTFVEEPLRLFNKASQYENSHQRIRIKLLLLLLLFVITLIQGIY